MNINKGFVFAFLGLLGLNIFAIFALVSIFSSKACQSPTFPEKAFTTPNFAENNSSVEVIEPKIASWYNYQLKNGVWWSVDHLTAASRDLPRYSTARVTNLANGKSVDVYINDYGPEKSTGRDIDLSSYAFSQIADLRTGLIEVIIELLLN